MKDGQKYGRCLLTLQSINNYTWEGQIQTMFTCTSYMSGCNIEQSTEEKDLGVDSELKFRKHVAILAK